MTKTIDYYFALVSPWSLIGHERLIGMARRHGAVIRFKPANVAKIFPATGGSMLKDRHPSRLAYRLVELRRWNEHLKFGLNIQPKFFPVPDKMASCLTILAGMKGHDMGILALAYMQAVWKDERDLSDPATVAAIASEQGLDGPKLLADSADDSPAFLQWEANTQEALEKGVHGVPWYLCEDEPFWGQDRLDFLERKLAGE
ncbi:MAG: 2-hydroxychromene-2-carboxylate isomerase [Rhodospirillales bacterium]|nr:2-hydroxychromene-2-carboxylate isomerase [Rhodospirillales bacterium]